MRAGTLFCYCRIPGTLDNLWYSGFSEQFEECHSLPFHADYLHLPVHSLEPFLS